MIVRPDPVILGQESAWAYPRPAIAERCERRIRILHRGLVIADSTRSVRTLETSHPPSYYIPQADIDMTLLRENGRRSVCEWKGEALYYDIALPGGTVRSVAWSYPEPTAAFAAIRDHLAFYAGPFEACFVDEERVTPQEGPFYGGWITAHVAGPFKGGPGTSFW
jgi:uncharacterized protein (DUF427 family)